MRIKERIIRKMKNNKSNLMKVTGADYQLNWQIENKKQEIIKKAEWLRENLDGLIKTLTARDRVTNSLGVLQGNGPDLDRLIGEYATLVEFRNAYFPRKEARS